MKITIVLATCNGELYIKEQLDSLLTQSFKDYRIIIGDDCSTDNTLLILKEYQVKHSNIVILRNRERLGVVSNFEKLIKYANSDYIALCDQDDIWHKDKLLQAFNTLEKYNNQLIPLLFHSDLQVINAQKIKLHKSFFKMRSYIFPVERSIDIMLGRCGVMGNTMMFNKALKEKILPFPKDLEVHDYWIALVNEFFGKRISFLHPLVDYRIHNTNTSNSLNKINKKRGLKIFLNRNIRLPYHDIKREKVLKEFLNRFTIEEKDKNIINHFINYLSLNQYNKLYIISLVFRYNFFRQDMLYRLKLIGAILWKRKLKYTPQIKTDSISSISPHGE